MNWQNEYERKRKVMRKYHTLRIVRRYLWSDYSIISTATDTVPLHFDLPLLRRGVFGGGVIFSKKVYVL